MRYFYIRATLFCGTGKPVPYGFVVLWWLAADLKRGGKEIDKDSKKVKKTDKTLTCVSSATENMSALIDDIIKKARKNFKSTGKPDVDAKFLKESVGALKELYDLLSEYDGFGGDGEGIIIKFEREIEGFCK